MEILEFEDKKHWNKFISEQKYVQFCQSFEWGEFQRNLGRKIWRLAIFENNKILAACLLVKMKLPCNLAYFYSPRGPIMAQITNYKLQITKGKIFDLLIKKIKELAKKERVIFWRFEPPMISNFGFRASDLRRVADVQPSKTLILNLEKKEEQFLAEMHPKTRYNIKLADKNDIKISYTANPTDKKLFLSLLKETTRRDNFKPHPDFYYQQMIKVLEKKEIEPRVKGVRYLSNELYEKCFLKLIKAEYKGEVLAINILIYFGDTVIYLHGASSDERRNLMAPYLLQWQAILDAKELGYQFYDFWGIDEKKWPGVTRFKEGFNGQKREYPGTFDLVLDKKWYLLYSSAKRVIRN